MSGGLKVKGLNMKKGIIILLPIICIIAVVALFIFKNPGNAGGNVEKPPENIIVPKLQTRFRMKENCYDMNDEKCIALSAIASIYSIIDDYGNNPDLKDVINRINNINYNYFDNLERQSTISECPEQAKTFKNRYFDQGYIYQYSNYDVAFITLDFVATDLCNSEKTNPTFEVYYYDVKWQKMRDEDWLLETLKLDKNTVEKTIVDYLVDKQLVKDKEEYNDLIKDKKIERYLYIDHFGDLNARYIDKSDDSFETIKLKTREEVGLPEKIYLVGE